MKTYKITARQSAIFTEWIEADSEEEAAKIFMRTVNEYYDQPSFIDDLVITDIKEEVYNELD